MSDEKASGSNEEQHNGDLQQLLDSTYPLLQKFRNECPGTYKHSQAVSAMIEGVAMVLGLDVNRMKVMALYHDVGKMFNPHYFTENQLDDMEEPHKNLDPLISYTVITRHVSDSAVVLLSDPNFPRDIIEIVSQHHGTSVLKYFFTKSGSGDKNAFRYKTTKPTCVESAVLMLCDHIEATSRALVQAGKFDPSAVIENTISGLIDDGQLDDVYMKLGDLKKIKEALAKELEGTYQKRVDYDKAKEESDATVD